MLDHEASHGLRASAGQVTPGHTRAAFLRRAALSGGALVGGSALLAGASPALAEDGEASAVTDVQLLNYALTLEHLEATFYTQGLQRFSPHKLRRAPQLRKAGRQLRQSAYDYLLLIRDHEVQHVETLTAVIKSLGGDPVPACDYNFKQTAFTRPGQFLAVAAVLENTGVMAYTGAIAYIASKPLVTAGATIATVEARHASYLNLLNGAVPFPDAFDKPAAPQEICKLVDEQFIVRCPFDLAAFCKTLPDSVIAP